MSNDKIEYDLHYNDKNGLYYIYRYDDGNTGDPAYGTQLSVHHTKEDAMLNYEALAFRTRLFDMGYKGVHGDFKGVGMDKMKELIDDR